MSKVSLIQHRFEIEVPTCIAGVAPASQKIIFVDPPYNIGVKYADDTTRDRLDHRSYEQFCDNTMLTLSGYMEPGATLWWLCPSAHMDFIPALLKNRIGKIIYRIIKGESFAQYQQKTLTDDYRMLFVAQREGGKLTFNPDPIRIPSLRQTKYGDKRADGRGRVPGQTWPIRRLQGTSVDHVDWHPAQLPPELLHRVVRGWSNPGDSVMDAFAGSGNMGLCSRREGRNFVGLDQSPTYLREMRTRLGVDEHGRKLDHSAA